MNFDDAIRAHAAWKMRLSNYIRNPDGTLNPAEVAPDNQCSLGQWIYENLTQYGTMSEFNELKTIHANFHRCAADIVERADKGENLSDEVALGTNSQYASLSADVVSHIMALKKKV